MTAKIPESHVDLLTGPVYATLTTISPSGAPENTIIWCSWDGTHVLVNTAEGRRKPKNVRANPKVALMAMDPQDAYRWIDVRGIVEEIAPDPEYVNINAHTKLYVGADEYYGSLMPAEMKGTEERVIFKIRPKRIVISPPPA